MMANAKISGRGRANAAWICDRDVDHIQCIATLNDTRQLSLVFPDYQGSRANDIEVLPMAPTAACTVSVPLVVANRDVT